MTHSPDNLIELLRGTQTLEQQRVRSALAIVDELSPQQLAAVLNQLIEVAPLVLSAAGADEEAAESDSASRDVGLDSLWDVVLSKLVRNVERWGPNADLAGWPETVKAVEGLYFALPSEFPGRARLLELLSRSGNGAAIKSFVELLVTDPPRDGPLLDRAMVPLFRQQPSHADILFPRLWDGLGQVAVATAIVDLSNFLTREALVEPHPGTPQAARLAGLLGELVQGLESLPKPKDVNPDQLRERAQHVGDSVALAVALCDALGWIGQTEHIGKLNQALQVPHRRLHTEAAAALARLGDEGGKQALIEAAEDSATRLRSVHYARELGLEEEIKPEYRSNTSMAEAELAAWLADPHQLGIAPGEISVFHSCELHWPGFNDLVECFLVSFTYEFGSASYSNIGIAGPVTHAFQSDLTDLPPRDIYAAFAGWHATHADIYEISLDRVDDAMAPEIARLTERAKSAGFEKIEPETLGSFFGERFLIGRAVRDDKPGVLAIGMSDECWCPDRPSAKAIDSSLAYSILKGRRLLQAFNDDELE